MWSPRRTKIRARMSPGVAIPWPAAPPMPMARSTLFTAHLLSERSSQPNAGPRRATRVAGIRGPTGEPLPAPESATTVRGETAAGGGDPALNPRHLAPSDGRGQGAAIRPRARPHGETVVSRPPLRSSLSPGRHRDGERVSSGDAGGGSRGALTVLILGRAETGTARGPEPTTCSGLPRPDDSESSSRVGRGATMQGWHDRRR